VELPLLAAGLRLFFVSLCFIYSCLIDNVVKIVSLREAFSAE